MQGRRIEIRGVVQGVGFRPFVHQTATRLGVTGRVRNDSAGVIVDAFGDGDQLRLFVDDLLAAAPPAARIRDLDTHDIPWEPVRSFEIVASAPSEERRISIPPDLAICDECLAEVFDPGDRRYLYPFTNCTNCGPRYSIVQDVPYDRAKTTMSSFKMCPACRAEYEDPANRRFHAEPNACPECGPRVAVVAADGKPIRTDSPVEFAARAVRAQMIVAIKGIGGFHLACDATRPSAVQRLRERKRRDAKPLAVMVRDLKAAEELAEISDDESALLTSPAHPVVLVRRRPGAGVAFDVAQDSPLIGLVLPYTPLHHILLREAGIPLVMTSGNLAEEPMVHTNEDALAQLGEVADIFLLHDRVIETRVDDSVARVIDGAPVIMRRARGFVPRGIHLAHTFAEPVLACGAHLKNAVCIGTGDTAFLGPHIGDLESLATLRAYEHGVEQMKKFVGVEPRIIAHDLHPDYFSTRYALSQAGARTVGVQHHHAHIVSAMAEHGLSGSVLGFAYDGTGFGTDGTSWGGEALIASETGFERIATFRAIPLPGGDQAIRQVWRIALAALDDAFDGEPPLHRIPLFRETPSRAIESIRRMVARKFNSPLARGVGRYFDALGAIGLAAADSRFEGEVALRWNNAADPNERGRYEVVIRDGVEPWEVDLRPMIRAAVLDLIAGRSAAVVSARFHNTLARTTVEIARAALALRGDMPVVLSGGCFQNALLAEAVLEGLRPSSRVCMNNEIPPGDGGIALGQAIVADAIVRSGLRTETREEEVAACRG